MARAYEAADERARRALAGSAVAFGVFDGFHIGHRYLVDEAIVDARRIGARSCVLTFDVDPDELFRPRRLRKLMANGARIDALAASGADAVVVLPFDERFAALSPEEFLSRTFGGAEPAALHVGRDMRFGAGAAGDADALGRWGARAGCRVVAHELVMLDGAPVTATRIRALLADGAIEGAARLLGRPYALEGTVVEGRHEGRDMGFRTANLQVPTELLALGEGVYAAYADVAGVRCKAAVSVGVAPTFAETATANVEAHLIDFDDDIYGERITLRFHSFLRPMIKFDSVEELVSTVMGNIDWVRKNL